MEESLDRYAPLAGAVFIVLVLVGFAIEGNSPGLEDPAEIVDFYADNEARVKAASALAAVGAIALVLFASHLSALMRQAGSRVLGAVVFGGGVIAAAGVGVDSALRFALAESAGKIGADATQAMYATWNGFFWPMHLGLATLMLAVSSNSLGTRLLPGWLVGLGILASVLLLIPVVALLIIGIVGAALWTLITSVLVFRRPPSAEAAPA